MHFFREFTNALMYKLSISSWWCCFLTFSLYFSSSTLFFPSLVLGVWPPLGQWGPLVCVSEGGGRMTEGVWGRVVGERRRWSWRSTGVAVAVRWSRGGWLLTATLALIETSDVTKTSLTGQLNGAVVTEQLPSASHTARSPLSSRPAIPLLLIHAISLVVLTYFICSPQCCGPVLCVKAWCVCPHPRQCKFCLNHLEAAKGHMIKFFKINGKLKQISQIEARLHEISMVSYIFRLSHTIWCVSLLVSPRPDRSTLNVNVVTLLKIWQLYYWAVLNFYFFIYFAN